MMFPVSAAVLGYLVAGVAAQTQPQFIVPPDANDRAKVEGSPGALNLVTTILHTDLGAGNYDIDIRYYEFGCQGSFVTPVTQAATGLTMSTTAVTSLDVGGLYKTQVTSSLEAIRLNDDNPTTEPAFYVNTPPTGTPTGKAYQFCIEYSLRSGVSTVVDVERYDVFLQANTNGDVSTNAVVITDLATNPDATTFTARAYLCTGTPVVYTPVNPNFFQGDVVTICFESVNYPEASIIGIAATPTGLRLVDGAATYNINPGNTPSPTAIQSNYVAGDSCVPTTGANGLQRCAVAVTLTGDAANSIFAGVPTATSAKTVVITGTMTMRFGLTARRNVRVLFQAGETFPRNTNTTMTIVGGTADKNDSGCSACSEWFFLFKIICWIFKCLLGFS